MVQQMNSITAGNPSPISTPTAANLAACLAACQGVSYSFPISCCILKNLPGNPSCIAYTFQSNVCNLYGNANARRQTHDAPLNGVPAGNLNVSSDQLLEFFSSRDTQYQLIGSQDKSNGFLLLILL
jgi:hypothetical protein